MNRTALIAIIAVLFVAVIVTIVIVVSNQNKKKEQALQATAQGLFAPPPQTGGLKLDSLLPLLTGGI